MPPNLWFFFTFSPFLNHWIFVLNILFIIDSTIVFIFSTKNPSFALVWGVIHVRIFFYFLKIFYQAQMGLQWIYISRIVKGVNKNGLFSFQEMSVWIDKFWPCPTYWIGLIRITICESITTESTTCHYA